MWRTPRVLIVSIRFYHQEFACNGTLVEDDEMGQVIQLQGDQRLKIAAVLQEEGVPKTLMKIHGA